MSSSARFNPNITIQRPLSLRMGRCLLGFLACYAAAN